MCSRHVTPVVTLTMWLLAATACKDDELDASGEENEGALGETCDPTADPNDDDAEGRCAPPPSAPLEVSDVACLFRIR